MCLFIDYIELTMSKISFNFRAGHRILTIFNPYRSLSNIWLQSASRHSDRLSGRPTTGW